MLPAFIAAAKLQNGLEEWL